jgi:hypothetical protein
MISNLRPRLYVIDLYELKLRLRGMFLRSYNPDSEGFLSLSVL